MNLSWGAAVLVLLMVVHTNGDRNKFYTMPSSSTCGKTKDIDGAVISSTTGSRLYSQCYFTLEVDDYHSFSRKSFMLRFETWQVTDCTVKLAIYDGRHTTVPKVPLKTLTCNDRNPGIIYLSRQYAKLSLSHKQGSTGFNFRIVATVVDSSTFCNEFRCNNRHCIEKDLRCDGVDHCFDRSDETTSLCKARYDVSRVFNIGVGLIVGIVVIIIVVCLVIVVIAVCCCRRRRAGFVRGPPTTTITTTPAPVVAPPPGSYPAQPVYPMQQPPPPQQPGAQPAAYYPYGQGQGFAQPPPVQASYQQAPPAYQEASAPPYPMK